MEAPLAGELKKQDDALRAFKHHAGEPVPDDVLEVVRGIAKSGLYFHSWEVLRPVVSALLEQVVNSSHAKWPDCPDRPGEGFEDKRRTLLEAVSAFDDAPFTIQRLCEVLLEPERFCRSTHKLCGSIDKLLSVSSTQLRSDPAVYAAAQEAATKAREDGDGTGAGASAPGDVSTGADASASSGGASGDAAASEGEQKRDDSADTAS